MVISCSDLVTAYLEEFPAESERLEFLDEFLRLNEGAKATDRTNTVGHITASGVVIDATARSVLQVFHGSLGQFLLPGGHIENCDATPLEAATREVAEETGLAALQYLPFHYNPEVPLDIDIHPIAAVEDFPHPHYHCDFRYAFIAPDPVVPSTSPSPQKPATQWVNIEVLNASAAFSSLRLKLERLLSRELRQRRFYDLVSSRILTQMQRRPHSVVVTHLLPDALEYLLAVGRLSSVDLVIPKPRSIDSDVERLVASKFKVLPLARHPHGELLDGLRKQLHPGDDKAVVLFDIGGWFAPILRDLIAWLGTRLLGIIEDTENGHKRYEELANSGGLPIPIVSVARSPLKDNEDFLIGQSVVFSADAVLRENGRLIQYLDCAVLGFGKIGSSIAQHLLLRGVRPRVFDTDPIRRAAAYNRLGRIPPLDEMLATADVVFSSTGNHGLDINHFRKLKRGCFVFSVTSSDDEFNLNYLKQEYSWTEVRPNVKRLVSSTNSFHLVNDGNAVNFLHKAVVGEFINLVRAEMLEACLELERGALPNGLHELSTATRRRVAEDWLAIICDGASKRSPVSPIQV